MATLLDAVEAEARAAVREDRSWWVWVALGSYVVGDVLTTRWHVNTRGLQGEGNPIARWVIDKTGFVGLTLMKATVFWYAYSLWRRGITRSMMFMAVVGVAVVLWNLYTAYRLDMFEQLIESMDA